MICLAAADRASSPTIDSLFVHHLPCCLFQVALVHEGGVELVDCSAASSASHASGFDVHALLAVLSRAARLKPVVRPDLHKVAAAVRALKPRKTVVFTGDLLPWAAAADQCSGGRDLLSLAAGTGLARLTRGHRPPSLPRPPSCLPRLVARSAVGRRPDRT